MPCKTCGSEELVHGEGYFLVCSNCGTVQDHNFFQHYLGGINIIDDITYRLNFTDAHKEEVKNMINQVTQGEFRAGDSFSVLVGACCYVTMRKNRKPIRITEVVASINCELFELRKMVSRVVQFLGLQIPEFDMVGVMERTMKSFSRFSQLDVDKLDLMVKQGNLVMQCAINWFLTTGRKLGRKLGPMMAAVLVFVAELNGIKLKMEDVASELSVVTGTCKKRHTELLEALVKVGQKLPWGKDVNAKNIMKNAKFVIQYMEMKYMANMVSKRKRVEDEDGRHELDVVKECSTSNVENQNDDLRNDQVENLKVSPETVAKLYQKFKTDVSAMADGGQNLAGEGSSHVAGLELYDWWSGRSDLCKKLSLEQIREKDVGLDVLPPSYVRGCLALQRRREKIKAAKMRMEEIISPSRSNNLEKTLRACLPSLLVRVEGKGKA